MSWPAAPVDQLDVGVMTSSVWWKQRRPRSVTGRVCRLAETKAATAAVAARGRVLVVQDH